MYMFKIFIFLLAVYACSGKTPVWNVSGGNFKNINQGENLATNDLAFKTNAVKKDVENKELIVKNYFQANPLFTKNANESPSKEASKISNAELAPAQNISNVAANEMKKNPLIAPHTSVQIAKKTNNYSIQFGVFKLIDGANKLIADVKKKCNIDAKYVKDGDIFKVVSLNKYETRDLALNDLMIAKSSNCNGFLISTN